MRVKSLALAGTAVAALGMGAATPAFAAAPERWVSTVSNHVECYGTVTQGSTTYGKVFVVHRHHHLVGGLKVTKTAKPGTYGIKGDCMMVPMHRRHWRPSHTATVSSVTQTTVVPKGAAQTGFGGSQESSVPLTAAALSLLLAGGAGIGLLARRRFQARARS